MTIHNTDYKPEDHIDSGSDDKQNSKEAGTGQPVNWKKEIMDVILPALLIVAVFFVLTRYVIILADIPTGSMLDTIQLDDKVLGNRLAYDFGDPERGDVVIFYAPDEEDCLYIKRLIGLPGDKVCIDDGKIYINDSTEPLDEPYLKEEWVEGCDGLEYQVPENCYFFLGDNRNDSLDARYWINTYVEREDIVAKALFIYWPVSDWSGL